MNAASTRSLFKSSVARLQVLATALCLTLGTLMVASPAQAQSHRHYQSNTSIFGDWELAKGLMTMAHMTAELRSANFDGWSSVVNSQGSTVPGAYTLNYTYKWRSSFDGGNYTTRFVFFFSSGGYLTEIQAKTPGSFFPPFGASTLTANLLIELIKEEIRTNGTQTDQAIFNTLVQSGDTKELTTFLLKLNQRSKLP